MTTLMPAVDDILVLKKRVSSKYLNPRNAPQIVSGPALTMAAAIASADPKRNLHAIGVGYKIVNGKRSRQLAVRLYVVQKLPKALLGTNMLPKELDGYPTDIIESLPATMALPAKRQRPLIAGISIAHFQVTAGTLGYFVRSTDPSDDPKTLYVLSNNHVLANVNHGKPGDDVYQPAPADGGTSTDTVAKLHRFVPIQLGQSGANQVDCAIAAILPTVKSSIRIQKIGKIASTAQAEEDMLVRKFGRTSGYSEGRVDDISYDALVGMDHANPNVVAKFVDQFRIAAVPPKYPVFGLGGDSGSLVVQKDKPIAVGLYFAGPQDGSYGIANPIEKVLNELKVMLA